MSKLRVGGQAFGDGVLMRTKKYWALVKEDGSTEFGSITSWLDHNPRWNIFLIRSIITFIEMIKFSMQTYRRNPAVVNRRILFWIGIYLAITLPLSMIVRLWFGEGMLVNIAFQLFCFTTAFWSISKGMSRRIWSFHGAEHKAVNAFEQDKDMNDVAAIQSCSRLHPRCGTNLVFLILLMMALYIPYPEAKVNLLFSGLYSVLALGLSLEIFRQLARFPKLILTRMMLFGGRQLQKFVTTKEPDDDQVVIASKALQIVLALEDMGGSRSKS